MLCFQVFLLFICGVLGVVGTDKVTFHHVVLFHLLLHWRNRFITCTKVLQRTRKGSVHTWESCENLASKSPSGLTKCHQLVEEICLVMMNNANVCGSVAGMERVCGRVMCSGTAQRVQDSLVCLFQTKTLILLWISEWLLMSPSKISVVVTEPETWAEWNGVVLASVQLNLPKPYRMGKRLWAGGTRTEKALKELLRMGEINCAGFFFTLQVKMRKTGQAWTPESYLKTRGT